ncbi:MAG: choice-of-anchor D domain-containing protein [Candidatus Kapaibacterium sp.]
MKIPGRIAPLLIPLLMSTFGIAQANLATDYVFIDGSGSAIDMTGSTTLMSSGNDDVWSSTQSIGFDFLLDGQTQSYFIASTNGPMMLGSTTSISYPSIYAYYSFNEGGCPHPIVTAFFDDLVASGNGVRTKLVGSAPNRIRVVDWEAYLWYGNGTTTEYHFQVRLYEGSNKIELWYGTMGSTDATDGNGQIGTALTTSNFLAVALGNPNSASGSIAINDLSATPISQNTLFTLRPCEKNFTIAGNTAQGGTATMDSGAVLLNGTRGKVGNTLSLQPFSLTMGEFPCGSVTYSFVFSGTAAADYSITPASGTIGSLQTITPQLNFIPSDTGLREATLRITSNKGFNRSYTLKGEGFRCIEWVGDESEGGTPTLESQDVLFDGIQVPIGSSDSYKPIRISQLTNAKGCDQPFDVTYTLNDPTGSYEISPAFETVPAGGSSIPTITFNALNGVGYQEATLRVTADGEVRTFILRNFISAPGGQIYLEGDPITSSTRLLRDRETCVGESVISIRLEAVNLGTGDFVVRNLESYFLDTLLGQGVPSYPLLRDNFGQPVRSQDYFLSAAPGVAPRTANGRFDSLIVPEGQSRFFYLNFIPVSSGKRFAKIYFPTNAFNLRNPNVFGDSTQGLLSAAIYSRGLGSELTSGPNQGRPTSVVFTKTKVRESSTTTATLYNDGDCDLRISEEGLRFESGDVDEFEIIGVTGGTKTNGVYTLLPGQSLDLNVRFSPIRSGSRRATVRLITNDSSLIVPEVTERGIYYWEFYGQGKFDLEARDLNLAPAAIGAESSSGVVPLENTKMENVSIKSIEIVGGVGDIVMDPNNPWPAVPFTLKPGEQLNLGVTLLPDPNSTDGMRKAEILIILTNGDTTRATIRGYAGTRILTVNPTSLFENKGVPVGELARAYFTVTNSGTLPTVFDRIDITGASATEYTITPLRRRVLEPGQTEFFEVTFGPTTQGVHLATIEIHSNEPNTPRTIALGGEGTTTAPTVDNPSVTIHESGDEFQSNKERSVLTTAASMMVQIAPNPTSGSATIGYTLSKDSHVLCNIYTLDGRLVRTIEGGVQKAGERELQTDMSDLPVATYFVVLEVEGNVVIQRMNVVR